MLGLLDEYPPMDMDQRPDRALHLDADYPAAPSKWLNLPFLPIKLILVLPHLLILVALGLVASLLMTVAQFVILFTGSFPEGMHGFIVGYFRWGLRVTAYLYAITDQYPPFSMS